MTAVRESFTMQHMDNNPKHAFKISKKAVLENNSLSNYFRALCVPHSALKGAKLKVAVSALILLAPGVLYRLTFSQRVFLLAPGVSFYLARSQLLVWSHSPSASRLVLLTPCVLSGLAHPQSGLARPRRLVLSHLSRLRRLVSLLLPVHSYPSNT